MADDKPMTVDAAVFDLIAAINPAQGVTAERVVMQINALIAAVRAEREQ